MSAVGTSPRQVSLRSTTGVVVESDIAFAGRRPTKREPELRVTTVAPGTTNQAAGEEVAHLRVGGRLLQTISHTSGGWRLDFDGVATAVISYDLASCVLDPSVEFARGVHRRPILAFILCVSGNSHLHGSCVATTVSPSWGRRGR